MSRGLLQPDLWVKDGHLAPNWQEELEPLLGEHISRQDWQKLVDELKQGFCRNSEFIAYMPTATTGQIAGQNECFEPYTAQLYARETSAGTYTIPNKHLRKALAAEGLWDDDMRRRVIEAGGSVQKIPEIPDNIKRLFRNARELDQRLLLLNAKAFAPFVDQSMSLNYYFEDLTLANVATLLSLAEKEGLKTAWYYMHTKPATGGQKSSVIRPTEKIEKDLSVLKAVLNNPRLRSSEEPVTVEPAAVCKRGGDCTSCGV